MSQFCNLASRIFEGVGEYDIPEIQPVYECSATQWLSFTYVKSTKRIKKNTGAHFFVDDYQFERVWNEPNKYINSLRRFDYVLSPDFSMYADFPKAVCIYNHYRKHWLAAYWQEFGITVIPTICWMGPDSYDWCFDGEPKHSVVAVSNVGCMKKKESRKIFEEGYNEMLKRLEPTQVLFYTGVFNVDYPGPVRYIRHQIGLTSEVKKDAV